MRKFLLNIILLIPLALGLSQDKLPIDNPDIAMSGLSIFQTNYGAGLGGFYEKNIASSHKLGVNGKFIVTRGEGDFPQTYYDRYSGRYYPIERIDKRRLYLFELYLNYKKLFFTDQIANNFRPFVEISAGPILGLDPPNRADFSFWKRWKNMDTPLTLGGNIKVGFDYIWKGSRYFSLSIGYDYIKFGEGIDPPPDFSDLDEDYTSPYRAKSDFTSVLGMIKIGWIL